MKLMILPVLCLLGVMHSGCKENFTYPEFNNVTEIEVRDWGTPIKKINDRQVISHVLQFINKRRVGGWETPITGFPSTKLKAYFYRDGQFVGSLGVTKNSFSMQRGGRWDSKSATAFEVQEFLSLIRVDKALLE